MLVEVSPNAERLWLGADDEDLKRLLSALEEVGLPEDPHKAWGRIQILHRIKNCVSALELDHIKVLKKIENEDPHHIDTAADRLSSGLHMRPNAAYATVCTACELERFPDLNREVHRGEVSPEATTVILQTLSGCKST